MWEWVWRSPSSTHGLVSGTGISPNFRFSAYAAHQSGLVLRYGMGRPVITPQNRVIGPFSYC